MTPHGMVLFCVVYVLATATPGPGIAALIARALGRGPKGLPAFIAGYVVGDLVWLTLAVSGMAMLARSAQPVFAAIRYLGAGYLLYLAWRIWTAPAVAVREAPAPARDERAPRLFAGSLALTMGNPKVMVFFLALLPTVIDLRGITLPQYLAIVAAICIILTSVLTAYAIAALRARRLFSNARAVRWLNRGTGTVMAGAAVAVATH
jgi:threonine/homoserine/homoserine lactone efflux protein